MSHQFCYPSFTQEQTTWAVLLYLIEYSGVVYMNKNNKELKLKTSPAFFIWLHKTFLPGHESDQRNTFM